MQFIVILQSVLKVNDKNILTDNQRMNCYILAMTEPESTGSEMEERSANVSDVDMNTVCISMSVFFLCHYL